VQYNHASPFSPSPRATSKMDYKGQQLNEYIFSFLTIFCGAIALIVGWFKKDFQITFYGWSIGLILSLVLCIPDWPMFNRNKIIWLEEIGRPNKSIPVSSKDKSSTGGDKVKQGKSKKPKKSTSLAEPTENSVKSKLN